ncbi:IclR family transcriptional regulator [Alteribacter lacisalsi]|uniref:Glycerol operon regulatory protein n=1 Tax=Alteribacter lacisalsi TaxID=2045244 RepID=A0A2W0H752_9BACI|nr:IclR family transcriptional regulator [Alteribacter lacisalsi]PYZ95930.1 IclR family transcriptional regulator [Alteribacter lacisalsi]
MSSKTVDKALDVLEMFSKERPSWRLRELARELDMSHSIVYRILTSFQERGYVHKCPQTDKYELGIKLLELSSVVEEGLLLTDVLKPVMERLAEEVGESIVFTILDNEEGVYVSIVESNKKVRFAESVGKRLPLYVGASHKTILAHLPKEIQRKIVTNGRATRQFPSLFTQGSLLKRLEDIQQQGWAYSAGETFDDVAAISVPIFDYRKTILGSLSVAGPRYRFSEEQATEKLPALKRHQKEVHGFLSKTSLPVRRGWVETMM